MSTLRFESLLETLGSEKKIHYSLDNFQNALNAAGNPEKTVKSIVIAGTNGKGTTTLLLSRALQLHGYRVGTYLSPHLQHVRERFLESLKPWSEERLLEWGLKAMPLAQKYHLSYFEFLTLMFFLDARDKAYDFNVVEVGMGGRLDATNVTSPIATVITNISWDHADFLGDSLEKILKEKMGVLRPAVPVISSIPIKELKNILQEDCRNLKAPLYFTETVSKKVIAKSLSGQEVEIAGESFTLNNPSSGTLENAVNAYLVLKKAFPEVSTKTMQEAFASVIFPGRFEVVDLKPLTLLSGDHNEAGIESLIHTLNLVGMKNPIVLCGFSPDKEAKKMIEKLKPLARELILTKVPRARGVYEEGYEKLANFIDDPELALKKVQSICTEGDTLLITGSLYLVGQLRRHWRPQVEFLK